MTGPTVPPLFDYRRPGSLAEALDLMRAEDAMALAGGTDLVTLRASGALAPRRLVDLKHLPELRGVRRTERGVWIGPATTCIALAEAASTPELGALADGASIVGASQTRARATVGGNVCRSSPAGDMLCPLLVLGAEVALRAKQTRNVRLSEFFTGPGRNVRHDEELLVGIVLTEPVGASAYARFTYRRAMDLAVVGVACRVTLERERCAAARVAIGALAPTARLVPAAGEALVGSAGEPEAVDRVVEALGKAASPIDDVRGRAHHRMKVLAPLARDVVERAFARARSGAYGG